MNIEYTVALIKPDAFRRRLVGPILHRIELAGFEMRVVTLRTFSKVAATEFYGRQHLGQPYFPALVDFMASGQSLRLLLAGDDAIARWRRLMGPWKLEERATAEGRRTIRGEYMLGNGTMENLVHGSDSAESFRHEALCLGWHPSLLS